MLILFHWLTPLVVCLVTFLEHTLLHFTQPSRHSIVFSPAADVTRSKADLVAENAPLRQPLIILHRQVKKPTVSQADRLWLVLLASRVKNWKEALLIFKPDTLLRWHRQGFRLFWKFKSRHRSGRPRLEAETVALIQQMAWENRLRGAERIRGELLKLRVSVAKHTIQTYITRVRPAQPTSQTWATFLKNHAKDIWACDLLPVIDVGFRPLDLFFIVELASRRIVHFGVTRSRPDDWVAQQLREATPLGQSPGFLIRDRDSKYGDAFTRVAAGTSIRILKTPYRALKANAICERFLGSVRRECLDHILVSGEQQLYRVIREYVAYFNRARPHQGIEQQIPEGSTSAPET
ncbi:MAG: integrase core domain-containing protein, partial [Chloroflexi bacterium]|nr:integrase core domain-containing protein [Chloroflexota bacterium]